MTKIHKALIALLIAALSISLVACGGGGQTATEPPLGGTATEPPSAEPTEAPTEPPQEAEPEKITIRFNLVSVEVEDNISATTGQMREGYSTLFKNGFIGKGFENVQIEIINIPWEGCWAKQRTMMQAGDVDVMYTGGAYCPIYYKEGLTREIDSFVDADPDFNPDAHFLPGIWDGARVMDFSKTVHIGMPSVVGQRYTIQDTKLFEDWGQPLLPDPPTPEDILSAAKAMTGTNPVTGEENFGLFFPATALNGSTFVSLLTYYGAEGAASGSMADPSAIDWRINTPEVKNAMTWIKEAVNYCPPGIGANQGAEMKSQEGNNVAIFLDNNGQLETSKYLADGDDYWIKRDLPAKGIGKEGSSWITYDPYILPKNGKHQDIGYELLKFMGSYETVKWLYFNYQRPPGIVQQDFIPDFDIYTPHNSEVISLGRIHDIWDEQNEFWNQELVPFFQGYLSDCAVGIDKSPDILLAEMQTKAEDWSNSLK